MIISLTNPNNVNARPLTGDTVVNGQNQAQRYSSFYDSLKVRASKKNFTRILHDIVVPGERRAPDYRSEAMQNYAAADGKVIGKIEFLRLDVFGPSLQDTSRLPVTWFEKTGNLIHTRSDLNNLRKNLVVRPGDTINAEVLYENERIFRTMARIRDARFIIIPDTLNKDVIDLLLITQDRFSIGVSGMFNGTSSAQAELYNRNFFGLGHEVSLRFVGHLNRQPYLGFESFYSMNNINGKFLSFSAGYSNTYRSEGAMIKFEKPLIRTSDKFAYGIHGYNYKRQSELPNLSRIFPFENLHYAQLDIWGAMNFQIGQEIRNRKQLTFAAQYMQREFKARPLPPPGSAQLFSNTSRYLLGITWSQRTYDPDRLIYGYGITEYIPRGYKYEIVAGIDDDEFGERIYTHAFLSNGNILKSTPNHIYVYGGVSSFFRFNEPEQAMVEAGFNYISRLHGQRRARIRHFIRVDYKRGINRFAIEQLGFEKNNLIRGFSSRQISGQERLSASFETVYFQQRDFYRFNIAFFTFADIGILGAESKTIFKENYYVGVGAGMRLHNESLVLKTILVRLAIYPKHPKDVGLLGGLITEQTKQSFYNFQPGPPAPRRYE
jgi:hypothetical protein